ncbi:hypothetical protein TGGT1_206670 [Toxoplasma gondii GT1]|nr:hypothetical protein TGGT1_206670 [Toxoplasma gondii GT1]
MEEEEAPPEGRETPCGGAGELKFESAVVHASVLESEGGEDREEEEREVEYGTGLHEGRLSPGQDQGEVLDEGGDADFADPEDEEKLDFSNEEPRDEGELSLDAQPLSGGEEELEGAQEDAGLDGGDGDPESTSGDAEPPPHSQEEASSTLPDTGEGRDGGFLRGSKRRARSSASSPRSVVSAERVSAALAEIANLCEPDSDEEGEISEDEVPFCRVTPQNPSFRSRTLEFLNLPPNLTHIALQEALSRVGEVEEVVSSRFASGQPDAGQGSDSSRRRASWLVRFRRADDAAAVRKSFDGKVFGKCMVQVLFARDTSRNAQNRRDNNLLSPDGASGKRQLGKGAAGANAGNVQNLRGRQSPPAPGASGPGTGAQGPGVGGAVAGCMGPGSGAGGGPPPVGVAGLPAGPGVRSPLGPPPPFPPRPGGAQGPVGPPMGGPLPPPIVGGPLGLPRAGFGGPMGLGGPPPPPPPPAPMMGRGGQSGPCCPPPPPPQQPGPGGVADGRPGGGKAVLRPRPDAAGVQGREVDAVGAGQGTGDAKVRLTPREEGPPTGEHAGEETKGEAARETGKVGGRRFAAGATGKVGVGGVAGSRERLTAEQRLERPVSFWREKMTIEEQMNDYRELWKKFGYTNRYLLLSNIPQSLLSMEAMTAWLQTTTGESDFDLEFIPPLPRATENEEESRASALCAQSREASDGGDRDGDVRLEGEQEKGEGESEERGDVEDEGATTPHSEAAEESGVPEEEADMHSGEGQDGEEGDEGREQEDDDREQDDEDGEQEDEDREQEEDLEKPEEEHAEHLGDEESHERDGEDKDGEEKGQKVAEDKFQGGDASLDRDSSEPEVAGDGGEPQEGDLATLSGGAADTAGSAGEEDESLPTSGLETEMETGVEKRETDEVKKEIKDEGDGTADALVAAVKEEKDEKLQLETEVKEATGAAAAGPEVVAHITYRTKKACMAAQKKLEVNEIGIEIEPAGPRKANSVLWLGNVREFMCKKPEQDRLRSLFEHFGEVVRFRLLAEKTCGFVHYRRTRDAVKARNHLYGLLVGREIYLNVDFSPLDPNASHASTGGDGSGAQAAAANRRNRHARSRSPSASSRFRTGSSRRGQAATAAGSGSAAFAPAGPSGDPRHLNPSTGQRHTGGMSQGGVPPPSPASGGGGPVACRGQQFQGLRSMDGPPGPPGPSAGGPNGPGSIPPPPGCPWGGGSAPQGSKRPGANAGLQGSQQGEGFSGNAPFPPSRHPLPPPPGSPYNMPANAGPGVLAPGGAVGPHGAGASLHFGGVWPHAEGMAASGHLRKDAKGGGMLLEGPGVATLGPGNRGGRGRGGRGLAFQGNLSGAGHAPPGEAGPEGHLGRGRQRRRKDRGLGNEGGSSSESDQEDGDRTEESGHGKRRRNSGDRGRRHRKDERRGDKDKEDSLLGLIRERLRERAAASVGSGGFGRGQDEEGTNSGVQPHTTGRKADGSSSDPLMDLLRGDPSLLDSMILDLAKERLKAELFSKADGPSASGTHAARPLREPGSKLGDPSMPSPGQADDRDRERQGAGAGPADGVPDGRRRRSHERSTEGPRSSHRDGSNEERGTGRPHLGDADDGRRGGARGRVYPLEGRLGRAVGGYMNGEAEDATSLHGRERRNSRDRGRERDRGPGSSLLDLPHYPGGGGPDGDGDRGRGRDKRGRNRYSRGGETAMSSRSRSRSRGSDMGERAVYYPSNRFDEGLLGRGDMGDRRGAGAFDSRGVGADSVYHHHSMQGRRMGPGGDAGYGMMGSMPDMPRMRGGVLGAPRGAHAMGSERDRSPFGPNKRQRRYYDEYGYRGSDRNPRGPSPDPMVGRGRRSPPFSAYPGRSYGLDEHRLGDKVQLMDEEEREGGKGLIRAASGLQGSFESDSHSPPQASGGRRRSMNRQRGESRRSCSRGSLDEDESERPTAGKMGTNRGEAGGEDEESGQLLMVCRVLKQGQRLCNMSAKFVRGDPSIRPPGVLDVNQRANLDRLQTHLRRGRQGGSAPHSSGEGSLRYSIWQLGADTRQDSRQYDELCDYFINKERVGLLESPSQAIYMVPPNPKYIKPLDLPDANFMYAYVIAK